MSDLKKLESLTGYAQTGFRPYGNQVALILSDDDLEVLGSKKAPKKKNKKSKIVEAPGLYKGEQAEKEAEEAKKDNRTFTVAAVSLSLAEHPDAPMVGDEVSLMAGTMVEVVVDGVVYGVIPMHRVLAKHKDKINP